MVKMGRVALDGTKLEASALRHKAMSYPRLVAKEEQVEAENAEMEAAVAGRISLRGRNGCRSLGPAGVVECVGPTWV